RDEAGRVRAFGSLLAVLAGVGAVDAAGRGTTVGSAAGGGTSTGGGTACAEGGSATPSSESGCNVGSGIVTTGRGSGGRSSCAGCAAPPFAERIVIAEAVWRSVKATIASTASPANPIADAAIAPHGTRDSGPAASDRMCGATLRPRGDSGAEAGGSRRV